MLTISKALKSSTSLQNKTLDQAWNIGDSLASYAKLNAQKT